MEIAQLWQDKPRQLHYSNNLSKKISKRKTHHRRSQFATLNTVDPPDSLLLRMIPLSSPLFCFVLRAACVPFCTPTNGYPTTPLPHTYHTLLITPHRHAGDSGSCFGAGIGAWGNALPLAYQHDEESEASEVVGLHATNISAFDLVPVFEAQEDLPSEWRETQDRLARSWRNSYHALGFLGHIFWVAIGIAPVALGAGVWKAHTLGEEDHGQPWGHVDVCITLALLVAYTMACVQSYYPGGRVLPAAASFSVWCVAVVVEMAFSDGRSAYVGDLSLVVPVAYWVSVGVLVFIAQRRFAENWTALQMAAPFSLTAVTVVFITSYVVPAMEDATDVQKLLVRCGWTVVVVAPTVTLLLKVHEAHLLLPNLVRLPIAGMEMSLLLPSKVVLYCMPVEWALLSEVFAQALRVLLAFLLMRWQTGLKTGKGACLASQVVFVSVQTDTCSSVAAAIIVCTRRGDRPASEVMSTLIIGAILPVLMSLFASAIQSVLLHKRKVPISCVYWMFQKVQHYLVMAAATTIATMITSPQILRLLEREEVRVNFL